MSSGYVFFNSHTLSQHEYSSTFKNIDGDVDKGDVSSGCGSMNTHTYLQLNDLESLMKDNYRIDSYTNDTLQNGDTSSGIGLLNSHTLHQADEQSKVNEINMSVDNGDVNGDNFYMNSSTGSVIRNHNSIDYTKKRDETSTNKYLREKYWFPDGVDIDDMLPSSAPNKYVKMEYNN